MKIESFHHALPGFLVQPLHGWDPDHVLEFVRPDPGLERAKGVFENILRWEDDGGQMMLPEEEDRNDRCSIGPEEHI